MTVDQHLLEVLKVMATRDRNHAWYEEMQAGIEANLRLRPLEMHVVEDIEGSRLTLVFDVTYPLDKRFHTRPKADAEGSAEEDTLQIGEAP